jgi:hypothetical protein
MHVEFLHMRNIQYFYVYNVLAANNHSYVIIKWKTQKYGKFFFFNISLNRL